MITCYIKYIVDPYKLTEFENYAKKWIPLVNKFGGEHKGYYLPHEGTSNVAVALFSFESLAAYEQYRIDSMKDPKCQEAYEYAEKTRCIISYERTFMRPLLSLI
ncbi:MAG: NIPSNAP family protein [Bacteroidota bacterium]